MLSSKFVKRIALGVAMTMTVAALTGCGSKAQEQNATTTDGGQEILIGGNLELTGGAASYGNSVKQAIELAFEEINSAGGVNGAKLKFVPTDNKSEASEAATSAVKLISQDQVTAILGPATSSLSIAAGTVVDQNKTPMISPTGTNPGVTVDENGKVRDYVFRTCFIDPFQGQIGAQFIYNELGLKKAALYVDNSSDYSKGLAEEFRKTFTALGGEIVVEEAFVTKDTDFKSTLTKIKNSNPEVIYAPAYYEEIGKIVRQARELGMEQPFVGGDGYDSAKLVEIAGAANLDNVFFTNHYSPEDKSDKVQNFIKNYESKYGSKPDALGALGYDAAYVLADAIKRAGSTDKEAIKKAIAETKELTSVTGKLTLDANHNPVKSAVIIELKDGVQTYKTTINP